MKTKDLKESEKLPEIQVIDATVTKSDKRHKVTDTDKMDENRKKGAILSEMRTIFDFDSVMCEELMKPVAGKFASGEMDYKTFCDKHSEIRKQCQVSDVTNILDFENRKGITKLLDEVMNLYGLNPDVNKEKAGYCSKYSELYRIFLVDEGNGLLASGESAPSIKVYSRNQNESGSLIAENELFYRSVELNASNIIAGIAGAELITESVRIKANRMLNDYLQSCKSIDNLEKRKVITADMASEMKRNAHIAIYGY